MAHDTIFGISAEFLRIRHISRIVALTAHDDSANLPNLLEFGTFAESRRDGTTMTRTRAFLAILGDVVGSRQIADRDKLRRDLKTALQRFRSPGVAGAIAGLPEITAGDEFQILLGMEPPSTNLPGFAAMEFLKHMTQSIRPAEITFGLGLGALGTELGAPVRELDGPCFHLARNALQVSKKEGRWASLRMLCCDSPAKSAPAGPIASSRSCGSARDSRSSHKRTWRNKWRSPLR
jgi:hypothetical protein